MFHSYSFAENFSVVQLVHSIISITGIFKLHKSVSVLQANVPNSSEAFKKSFYVALSSFVGQSPDKHSGTGHVYLCWDFSSEIFYHQSSRRFHSGHHITKNSPHRDDGGGDHNRLFQKWHI